jgi:chromate transporter
VGRGWVDHDSFLAGYGAAQAMPGPLFTFCGFLGASLTVGPGGIMGGTLALVAVFLPSWLLVLAAIPYWDRLRTHQAAQAALAGTNAAVVGLLLAAFYDPIWTNGITSSVRLAMGLIAFALLRFAHIPPWALVVACGVGGHALL